MFFTGNLYWDELGCFQAEAEWNKNVWENKNKSEGFEL